MLRCQCTLFCYEGESSTMFVVQTDYAGFFPLSRGLVLDVINLTNLNYILCASVVELYVCGCFWIIILAQYRWWNMFFCIFDIMYLHAFKTPFSWFTQGPTGFPGAPGEKVGFLRSCPWAALTNWQQIQATFLSTVKLKLISWPFCFFLNNAIAQHPKYPWGYIILFWATGDL